MKIWQALYNEMTYEGCAGTLSLHRTKEGAELAIKKHKTKDRAKFDKQLKWEEDHYKNNKDLIDYEYPKSWQWWGVEEMEIQD